MRNAHVRALGQLARLYAVQTSYYDVHRRRQQASPDALLRALKSLGAPIDDLADAPNAVRERRQSQWNRVVEPIVVAWDGGPLTLELRLPADSARGTLRCELTLEGGDRRDWECKLGRLPVREAVEVEGVQYVNKEIAVPGQLPAGYHRLTLQARASIAETTIVSAPKRAFQSAAGASGRRWGAFLPLYSLHSERSWGAGDFTDLEALVSWVGEMGGSVVATLPLLADFFEGASNHSPYSPVSRLFWNDFYIDVTRVPGFEACSHAQSLLESEDVHRELRSLRTARLVDYPRQMRLKRMLLEELAKDFYRNTDGSHPRFHHFVRAHPGVQEYARFRAVCERHGFEWSNWPQALRDGTVTSADYDDEAMRYHLFAQWQAHEQLESLSRRARTAGPGLYLDLPLGVHRDGFDVWRHRNLFAVDASGGAPPDAVFTRGQNWSFPPLHPEHLREKGYRYVIAYLRHHLKLAGILRIDHVMSLHRLFWIPNGMEAAEGVYVRYPAEELYAILSVESHRHKAWIVGENLGTVPSYVDATMGRHGIGQMYVLQYALESEREWPARGVPRRSVASLNTHDMPSFCAFWKGHDIEVRTELGLLGGESAQQVRRERTIMKRALVRFLKQAGLLHGEETDVRTVLRACLAMLSTSLARVVFVNLEDLWLEAEPQNVPGTGADRPNWRRKARYSFEEFSRMPKILESLRDVDRIRRREDTNPGP